MKKVTWLLFFGYFLVFVIFGVVFYFKFLNQFLSSGAEPEKTDIVVTEKIYYSEGNNLWILNPDTAAKIINHSSRIQSTGSSDFLDFNSANSLFAYTSVNPDGINDIWQFQLKSNQSEKITDEGDARYEILKNYLNFSRPKYSPTGGKLAFIARGGVKDSILEKDLMTGNISGLTPFSSSRIADYSWSSTGQKIVYCTSGLPKNYCEILDLGANKTTEKIDVEIAQISWEKTSEIIYLSAGNLFSLKEGAGNPRPITDVASPKRVVMFDIDPGGINITYQVNDGDASDIYLSRTDGTNNIELTSNKNSGEPHLSPKGDRVAFLRQNDGIYVIDANKIAETKILNINNIDHLLIWR